MQLVIPRPNRSFSTVDALAIIGVVGLSVARWIPIATLIPFWGCGFRKLTGIPCPGCGLTRVADRVAHFNVLGALHANPLGTVAAVLFVVCVVLSVLHLTFKMPVPELVLSNKEWSWVRWGALVAFTLNYGWVVFAHTTLHWR